MAAGPGERAAATGRPAVYRYYFTRRPPGAPLSSISPLTAPGVYHSAELYYVFNTLGVGDWPWETDDRHLTDAMSSYWANFAKTGDPTDLVCGNGALTSRTAAGR